MSRTRQSAPTANGHTKSHLQPVEQSRVDEARRRGRKPYPVMTFEDALRIGQGIMEKASGQPVKRVTLLDELGLPDSQGTRDLITNSGKYGLTEGGHKAQELSLTAKGKECFDKAKSEPHRRVARADLAILGVDAFAKLYGKYKGNKLPSAKVLQDQLEELDVGDRPQCVDIFIQNAKFVGLLRTIEGAEFLTAIEDAQLAHRADSLSQSGDPVASIASSNTPTAGAEEFDSVCFFIAPIGESESEHRRHSDAILSSYVEKALEDVEPKLKVIRADKIDQPGMISRQVIEYILKSRLVVADLSF